MCSYKVKKIIQNVICVYIYGIRNVWVTYKVKKIIQNIICVSSAGTDVGRGSLETAGNRVLDIMYPLGMNGINNP